VLYQGGTEGCLPYKLVGLPQNTWGSAHLAGARRAHDENAIFAHDEGDPRAVLVLHYFFTKNDHGVFGVHVRGYFLPGFIEKRCRDCAMIKWAHSTFSE